MVNSLPNGGTAWTADMYRVIAYGFVFNSSSYCVLHFSLIIVYSDGGNSSNPLDSLSPKDPRNLLFIDNNIAGEKQYVCKYSLCLLSHYSYRTWREKGKQADTNMKTAVETFNAAEEELTRLIAERRGLEVSRFTRSLYFSADNALERFLCCQK